MMEIFFETKDVFQLKDIEKIAPKEKGITSMSVKEILQSLVDDGMVDTDRIGTSNYFWAFPSKALHARKRKLEELESQFAESSQKKEALQKSIKKSKIGREDTAERAALMEELAALRQKKEQLKAEVDKYRECDPDVVEEMQLPPHLFAGRARCWGRAFGEKLMAAATRVVCKEENICDPLTSDPGLRSQLGIVVWANLPFASPGVWHCCSLICYQHVYFCYSNTAGLKKRATTIFYCVLVSL
ncbi:meiotic nuclear division protein 1 homolog isoform X2 [Neopelma chrysocephalum]|nr:meiotic nuclear division protein 1 homolog isoform X2 [Neopelma chrysocephalum]XP_027532693.1 meiotic nuclear division protein 1 homolog isoform X2 [Neopelma chrysocephalum]